MHGILLPGQICRMTAQLICLGGQALGKERGGKRINGPRQDRKTAQKTAAASGIGQALQLLAREAAEGGVIIQIKGIFCYPGGQGMYAC